MREKICLLFLITMLLFIPPACQKKTEADKIRAVISDVQKSAEQKKIMTILGQVSKVYQDPQGNDYDAIKGILGFYFFRHQKVSVFIPDVDVLVTGPTATATFQALFAGRGSEEDTAKTFLPDAMSSYNFEVSFRQEDSAWKVVSARWEQAGQGAAIPRQ